MNAARSTVALLALALAAALYAGWRIVATCIADLRAAATPERALAWDPYDPRALLALARRQLRDGETASAQATARLLLRMEPLASPAFGILAQAEEATGDAQRAGELYAIALRRAPRDLHARAWTVDRELEAARFDDALADLDILLRVWPSQGRSLLPALADLSRTVAFADALARRLSLHPAWREPMLKAVLERSDGETVDRLFGSLDGVGDLTAAEAGGWLDRLMREGRWGEAYSRWASRLVPDPGIGLSAVYDGGFERKPSGIGFDWRIRDAPGVYIERARARGASGAFALRISFAHRRAPEIGLAQTLLLAPGAYRLRWRVRIEALESDRGIAWTIACDGASEPLVESLPLTGSSDWKTLEAAFDVPAADCPAQHLGLTNPGAGGAGKIVSGVIWLDDVAIEPASASSHDDERR